MNIKGPLDLSNAENLGKWHWRWHLQGGCMHHRARDLQDLRNDEDMRRWRSIQIRMFQARRQLARGKKVVNVAKWKFDRIRKQRAQA